MFKIKQSKLSDETTIELCVNGLMVGRLIVEEYSGYQFFEDFITEETYSKITKDDSYLVLKELWVEHKYRGKGYANSLMFEFQKIIEKNFIKYDQIFLWANPFDSDINITALKEFYKKFGFLELDILEELYHYNYDVAVNYKNNLMLKNLN
jgi:ribosomal protein S18 acetylase RimI-like enzyme